MFAEAIQIYGVDCNYIVRDIDHEDFLFHEDILSSFSEYYTIELYLEDFETFSGGGDLVTQWGLAIEVKVILYIYQWLTHYSKSNLLKTKINSIH
jgi:hypothetical protein